ncbi:MAG: glycosyltransferase 87 family protein [Promethearchaeota archaeon]
MVGLIFFQEIALCLSTLLMLIPWIILLDRIEKLREFKIYILLLLGLITRLIFAPFFGHATDIARGYLAVDALLQGKSPYTNDPDTAHYHTPLIYITETLVFLVLGKSFFSFKVPIIISEVILGFVIYKTSIEFTSNERLSYWACALFLTNPWTYFQTTIFGHFDAIPTLFMVLAIYLLIKERVKLSALSLGIGTMYKLFPVLISPIVILYLARQKRWKHIIEYIAVIVLFSVIVSLPFLIVSYGPYISVLTASGGIRGMSIYRLLFYFSSKAGISINERIISMIILGMGILITLMIFIMRDVIDKNFGLLEESTFFLLIFMLLNRYLSEQYIVWTIPFLILYFTMKSTGPQLGDMALYYSYSCAAFFYRAVKWSVWFSLYDDFGFVFFSTFVLSILFWHLIGWLIAIRFFSKNLPKKISDSVESILVRLPQWLRISEKRSERGGLRSYMKVLVLQIDFSVLCTAIITGIMIVIFIFQGKTDVSFELSLILIILLSVLVAGLLRTGLFLSRIETSNTIYTFINFWIIYIFEVGIYFHTDLLTILWRAFIIALSSSLGYILISFIAKIRHTDKPSTFLDESH